MKTNDKYAASSIYKLNCQYCNSVYTDSLTNINTNFGTWYREYVQYHTMLTNETCTGSAT
jgi:hypothetical protein